MRIKNRTLSIYLKYLPTDEPEGTRLAVRFRLRLINQADKCVTISKERSATFSQGQPVFGCDSMVKLASE